MTPANGASRTSLTSSIASRTVAVAALALALAARASGSALLEASAMRFSGRVRRPVEVIQREQHEAGGDEQAEDDGEDSGEDVRARL